MGRFLAPIRGFLIFRTVAVPTDRTTLSEYLRKACEYLISF